MLPEGEAAAGWDLAGAAGNLPLRAQAGRRVGARAVAVLSGED